MKSPETVWQKLSNEKFVANAPEEVVAKENKLAELQGSMAQLTAKQNAIAEMA